jgi:hypothetical protein
MTSRRKTFARKEFAQIADRESWTYICEMQYGNGPELESFALSLARSLFVP